MLHTFEAVLKGNRLEWTNGVPQESDRPLKVYVTLLDESALSSEERREKLSELLGKIAATNAFNQIKNPVEWQRDLRHDRSLPGRENDAD
jgi:hypothetical protein